jgi:Xaa-Pro aminopeptidase
MRSPFLSVFLLVVLSVSAQENLPKDYLSAEFHKGRRDELRKRMPENSVVAIFAYPERVFSRDVNYTYHPNPDLYYFSGYKEAEAMLLIFKEEQKTGDKSFNEVIFVRQKNPMEEVWTGRRLGVEGVKKQLGFQEVYNSGEFKNFSIDLSKLNLIYDRTPDDIGAGMLSNLMKSLKEKGNVKEPASKSVMGAYSVIKNSTTPANLPRRVNQIKGMMANSGDDALKNDPIVNELLNRPDSVTLVSVQEKLKSYNFPADEYNKLVAGLREIKTPEELTLLRKSAFLSAVAHEEVMKAIQPNMSETELHGLFIYVHKKYGAEDEGYPPIVGTGGNGCILHYTENNATKLNNQLVLMDVGSEYHGYSADVTRTVPANGKFTPEQKAIYDLVYQAQEETFKICKEGTPFRDLNVRTTEVLAEGLLKLGIIKQKSEVSLYYIHGVSHHLGLDVHDKSVTPTLKENMVITVEPGIYIPQGSPCDQKWWDIAVRIEDDIVIGKTSYENISGAAPRKSEDVEKATAKKSVVNEMVLPKMK